MRVSLPSFLPLPCLLSFLPLLSSSLLPLVSWGGCGRGVETPINTSGAPTVPQRTPQQWRLQGVAKRPSRRPLEGIVEPSGLENDVKMSSQSNISVPFRRLGCKSEINALATVSARFWRSEGTQKCYHIAHKSMRHKVKTKPEGKSTLKSTSGGLR